jgi:hypothetical protein
MIWQNHTGTGLGAVEAEDTRLCKFVAAVVVVLLLFFLLNLVAL